MPMPFLLLVTACGGIGVMVPMVGGGVIRPIPIPGVDGTDLAGVSVGDGMVAGGAIHITITIITIILTIIRTMVMEVIGEIVIIAIAPIRTAVPCLVSVR